MLQSLQDVCPDAVFFTKIPRLDPEETETATETVESHEFVKPLRDLFLEKGEVDMNSDYLHSLLSNYKSMEQQVKNLEKEMRGQSVCLLWYEQRKGGITASKAHDILVSKETASENNLVQLVTGCKCYNFSNMKPVKWEQSNEEKAKLAYVNKVKQNHQSLHVKNVRLLVDHQKPFHAASPDSYVKCQCCEDRLLEVKYPYKHKDKTFSEITDKCFYISVDGFLKKSHRYYTQVQLQMYVFKLKSCDFIIYTNKDCKIISIPFSPGILYHDTGEPFFHLFVQSTTTQDRTISFIYFFLGNIIVRVVIMYVPDIADIDYFAHHLYFHSNNRCA